MMDKVDALQRNVSQAKAVISMIQLASENKDSRLNNDVLNDALWSVLDNLQVIDEVVEKAVEHLHTSVEGDV
ncbi:hypothetical protein DI392_17495 [Vibrio albus]|uniref:Uncharacterized protein n=1 Tax=Vibrio albus TaxID=2200953 RepID=A0A2U3B609_9VIBR|nr:hypothetical protein [Vibrio albus]PWI32154.1 hypothetical protein DI392_17495 [Vibrio albus]